MSKGLMHTNLTREHHHTTNAVFGGTLNSEGKHGDIDKP